MRMDTFLPVRTKKGPINAKPIPLPYIHVDLSLYGKKKFWDQKMHFDREISLKSEKTGVNFTR